MSTFTTDLDYSSPSFFFHCYGDHRDLHSFPTRRSSDLLEGIDPDTLAALQRAAADRQHEGYLLTLQLPDRKSTRLNSSHVAISYAVFCLKKKKQKKSLTYN